MNLETLYIQIEAETSKIKSQVAAINSQVSGVSKEAVKANKSLGNMGKAVIAAFSVRALIGFFNKFLEITKQTESFKKALAEALDPIVLMVQPALTAMITGIAKAVAWISGVIQAMTGWTGATKKQTAAAQAQKRVYAGFDELNVVPSETGAAAPVVEPLIETNKYVEQGKKFWGDYGKQITDITKLILALGAVILAVFAANAFIGFVEGLGLVAKLVGFVMAAWGDAYLVLSQGATAMNWLSATFAFLQGTLAGMLGTIAIVIAVVVAVVAAIIQLWNEVSERGNIFRENVNEAFAGLIDSLNKAWAVVEPFFTNMLKILIMVWENGVKPLWSGFVDLVAGVVNILMVLWTYWLKPIVDFFITFFGPVILGVVTAIAAVFGGLLTIGLQLVGGLLKAFGDLLTWFSTVLKGGWIGLFEEIGKAIVLPFKLAFNSIADMWNNTLGKINFTVPKWVPLVGGQQWTMPNIPRLAEGGMVNAGSLFVAGESGAELIGSHKGQTTVMPLQNTDFTAAMSQAVYGAMVDAMSTQGSGQVIINVDGMTLAKSVETNLNKLSTVQGGLKIAM